MTAWRSTQRRYIWIQDGDTALIVASYNGHASVVTLLLDAKAEVNLAEKVRQVPRFIIWYDVSLYDEQHLFVCMHAFFKKPSYMT